jgi:tetratricopeptide (TPR) repeat protein
VTAAAILTLLAVSGVLVNRILRERDLARSNFELVRSILESADPDRFSGVVQLLDGASDRLDRSPPKHEIAEAEIRQLVGSVYTRFGEYPKARANLLRAVAIRENHASGDDPAVADALHGLAASLWWEGKYNEAEPIYSRSLAMRRRLFPRDHASVAFSLTHLAACRLRMGKPDEARELYLEALEMRKRLYGQDHEEVAQALNNVARCDLDAERFDAAQQLFAQSLQMIRRVKGDAHSGTASASQNFGDCLIRRCEAAVLVGDQDRARSFAAEAQEHFQRALDIRNRIYPQGHHLIAMSLASLSRAELALGDPVQARETALRAVKMLEATRRATHPDMAEALDALGLATLGADRSRAPEASALLARALQILSAAPQPSDLMLARIQLSLATSLIAEGRLADARPPLTACVETLRLRRGEGARSPATRHAASMLRDVCTALGDDQAARTWGDLAGHH